MNKGYYDEYAALKTKKKALENQIDELEAKIIEEMVAEGATKIETTFGKFTVTMKKTWEYPQEVIDIGEQFKAAKATAESTGDATFTEAPSLRFTSLKL